MRILITNDDGIYAPGLKVLERIARELTDEVWVVAPETDQSGLAHSLTLHDPLRLRELGERRYAVRGTPTDCVIMAIKEVMEQAPDLVLSGVNAGQNAADDVTYSGTVAAAIEATLLGVPAIALSQAYMFEDNRDIPFATAEAHGPDLIRRVFEGGIDRGGFVNVNFPNCDAEAVAGVSVTRQGAFSHGLTIEPRVDGRNRPYYWIGYKRSRAVPASGTDIHALAANRISVTPLRLDLTDADRLEKLTEALGH